MPPPLPAMLLCLLASRVAGALYYPVLARGSAVRVWVLLLMAPLVLALPLLVPLTQPAAPLMRWFVAVDGAVILFKLWDLHLGHRQHGRPPLGTYLGHVLAMTVWNFSFRRRDSTPSPPKLLRAGLLALASILVGLGAWVLLVWVLDLGRVHFLLDHGTKALSAFLMVAGFNNLIATLRAGITGRPTLLPFDAPLLSATPAEFWRRWNRSVTQYLHESVFKPVGGRRHPIRGVIAAFVASGLLHEYIYSIALMKIQGYQLAFFGVHGVAVILTARVKPKGAGRHLWRVGNLVFLVFTSILFFASNVNLVAGLFTWHPHGAWLP